MKFNNKLVLCFIALFSCLTMQAQQMDLPQDTAVRVGRLENGLTYYIRYNNWPEKRANFYIAQRVGSIQEEESQRGLAHFLEHMCFNGSEHFKGNGVIRYCEDIGVQFGADLNAYTAIDRTVYNIDNVPTHRQSALDSCLLILSDWAHGLTLDPKEIDDERGVIHEEWRLRTSGINKMFERNLPKLYPGSKYGVRFPIGLMSVVDKFKYKELRDYYEKWYHPSNQAIIVVGDVDVDHVEKEIKRLFGPVKNPANMAQVKEESVPDNAKPIIVIDKEKDVTASMVEIMHKHDVWPDSLKNNVQYLAFEMLKSLATSMLNERLDEVIKQKDCPFVSINVNDGSYIYAKTKDAFGISFSPKSMKDIPTGITRALEEVRKAGQFGFNQSEFDRAKNNFMSSLDKIYSNKDKRYSKSFCQDYVEHFLDKEPIPSLDYYYQIMKMVAPAIQLQQVNEVIKALVPKNDSNLVVLNFNGVKAGNVYPTEAEIQIAIDKGFKSEVKAYVDNVKNEPLIKTLPQAGKIVKETKNDKFGYTTLKLSNGATVTLKQTDYKKDQVTLKGEAPGGSSLYGDKDLISLKAFNQVIGISGLGAFNSTELTKALAGKIANVDLSMAETQTNIAGSSTPKDVETMMQMLYLYFTQIKKDTESFNNYLEQMNVSLKDRSLSPNIAFTDSVKSTMYTPSKRIMPLLVNDLKGINYDRILQMAAERTANAGAWDFTIIGNFNTDSIKPLICRYIASLPVKGKIEKKGPIVKMRQGVVNNTFIRKMDTPKAISIMTWRNEKIPFNLDNMVKADVAGQILNMIYLKKIREEASAAYTCGARGVAYKDQYDSYITMTAYCPMKPEKKDIALKIMREQLSEMTKSCDADMLKRVKELLLKQDDDVQKTNDYWQNIMSFYRKYNIDLHTDFKATVMKQTPQSISAFVKDFLKDASYVTVTMLPQVENQNKAKK